MHGINKLPFLLGGFMTVFVGIISYIGGSANQTIYIRMAVVMVVFYIVGSIIRNTLNTIQEELKDKKMQVILKEQIAEKNNKKEVSRNVSHMVKPDEHRVNLVTDDYEAEFSPLTVSRIITSKMKE